MIEVERGVIGQGLPPLSVQREGAQDHHLLLHRAGGEHLAVQMREENVRLLPLLFEEDNRVAHHLLELEVELRGLCQQAQSDRLGHPQLGIRPISGVDRDRGVREGVGLGQSPGAQ